MKYQMIILVLLTACPVWAASTDTLTQWGITWTFSHNYIYGTFVNGDYWVVADSNEGSDPNLLITLVAPLPSYVGGRYRNGSMINPVSGANVGQGLDSYATAYVASLNAGRPGNNDVSANNPIVVEPGESLVSCISVEANQRYQIQDSAILTVVAIAPDTNSFRPAYAGTTDKVPRFTIDDVNYGRLGGLDIPVSAPALATANTYFARPWLDWQTNLDEIHPTNAMPGYGKSVAQRIGDGALVLQLDYTNVQKEALMVGFIQVGIDMYGILKTYRLMWWAAGGMGTGRKLLILFAGNVLNDPNMMGIGALSGDYLDDGVSHAGSWPLDYLAFSEDGQTFYVSATAEGSWVGDVYAQPYTLYTTQSDTPYPYITGTIDVNNGETKVTGAGTAWSGLATETRFFAVVGDNEPNTAGAKAYTVASIDSDTQLTLTETYRNTSVEGGTYKLADVIYYGHADPEKIDSGNTNQFDYVEFEANDIGIPYWGKAHAQFPAQDGKDWTCNYTEQCAPVYCGLQMAALITDLKTAWNHNAFFDYTDRWMQGQGGTTRAESDFAEEMYDSYRNLYPPVWPDANEPEEPDPNNNAPVLAAIGNKSVLENRTLTFDISATDADANDLTYSFGDTPPTGATLVGATFSWTPTYRDAGVYNVSMRVTDGELWDYEIITITVIDVPQYLIAR